MGLLTQTRPTEIGKLQRTKIATAAAMIICEGKGTNAINRPTKNAIDTERRLR